MAVVTLTFSGSDELITDGIPRFMTIESNISSTIYFTVNGATPTTNSTIYTGTFEMPTGQTSVILSAFGIDSNGVAGPILTQTFAADVSDISTGRHTGQEGFVLDWYADETNTPTGYDADGDEARFIDVYYETLDLKKASAGAEGLGEGAALEVLVPSPEDTPSRIDDQFQIFSTPEVGELFNPEAMYITIDNRIDNDIRIIPRPYGSLQNIYREYGGKRVREPGAPYITGGFVRRFYNEKNNVMVSYYADFNEPRYVKNIQDLPLDIPGIVGEERHNIPLVFKWIYRGRHSSLG